MTEKKRSSKIIGIDRHDQLLRRYHGRRSGEGDS